MFLFDGVFPAMIPYNVFTYSTTTL